MLAEEVERDPARRAKLVAEERSPRGHVVALVRFSAHRRLVGAAARADAHLQRRACLRELPECISDVAQVALARRTAPRVAPGVWIASSPPATHDRRARKNASPPT